MELFAQMIGGTRLKQDKYQCIGCGAQIQTESAKEIGYLPASAFSKGLDKGDFYCQRCFKLRNYNELQDLEISEDVFLDRLSDIAEDKAYIINLIDIFDVEGSLISGLSRFIGNQAFTILANKKDLLPKSTNFQRVKHWLTKLIHQQGLRPEYVHLIAANNKESLDDLIQLIKEKLAFQNVYIVGVTNVGKSTLINQFIELFGGDKEVITTSNYPGTTLDMIRIPITEKTGLIDTPGIIRKSQMTHIVNREAYKQVIPTKTIKPTTFQLNPGQTLFLAGLARVDYPKGDRMAITFYVSNALYIHRTKIENADRIYQEHLGGLLTPPEAKDCKDFPPLVKQNIKVLPDQDITISGLGWFKVNQAVELTVWLPKGIQLSRRESII